MCLSVNDRSGGSRRVGVSTRCALSRVLFTYSICDWVLGANVAAPMTGTNEKLNRIGRTEPNRVIPEPAGTGRGTEPNRSDRATACPKSASRTASNRDKYISEPNRTEPIHFRKVWNRNESNRSVSFLIHALFAYKVRPLSLPTNPLQALQYSTNSITSRVQVSYTCSGSRHATSPQRLARAIRRRGRIVALEHFREVRRRVPVLGSRLRRDSAADARGSGRKGSLALAP